MITEIKFFLNMIMRKRPISIVVCILVISLFIFGQTYTQDYQMRKISDNIFIVSNLETGESQVVIQSEKGLVVFNSFWSEITAQKFKGEIARALNRDDFSYVINMVDRLDMFGGNASYKESMIIGHEHFLEKYKGKEKEVAAEIQELIEMWRWKEEVSRERLETHAKGSEAAMNEQRWLNTCKRRADELEEGVSLILPSLFYNKRMALHLGDITLVLIWFGKAGNYSGQSVAVIPEEKLAILSKSIVYPPHHLAPGLRPDYSELDVPRWIDVMEEILEGENAVDNIILCDDDQVYSREQMLSHLEYVRKLWHRVTYLENEGKNLQEIKDILSLEKEFAFVKEMMAYKENGDKWVRPQHDLHTRLFFLQHKEHLASEIIKEGGIESLQASLDKINKLGDAVYADETSIWRLGYVWLNENHVSEAIEIFKLWVEAYPESFNAYDSLAEAYMKDGDTEKAIKNYNKSLELNPENNNAREMLKVLEKK